jgi:hypothetical protein
MKNKILIVGILVFFNTGFIYSQDNFDTWDKNYPEIDFGSVIEEEQKYADSIESNSTSQYYSRIDKYRFDAVYTGEKRVVEDSVFKSMKRVFKLYSGNPDVLNELVKYEYKFKAGNQEVWFPMQSQLEKPFKKEIKKNETVKLYCMFMNEHGSKKRLFNIFLISEFKKVE